MYFLTILQLRRVCKVKGATSRHVTVIKFTIMFINHLVYSEDILKRRSNLHTYLMIISEIYEFVF